MSFPLRNSTVRYGRPQANINELWREMSRLFYRVQKLDYLTDELTSQSDLETLDGSNSICNDIDPDQKLRFEFGR